MNILCIGDVVGKPGRYAIAGLVEKLKKDLAIDLVVVNAENAAGGSGLTGRIAKNLFHMGADVLTLGDHAWDQKDIESYLKEDDRVLRPANFPEGVVGKGYTIVTTKSGIKVGVVNILGRVFIRYAVECPFRTLEKIIDIIRRETSIIVVDFHAEATSEKVALGYFIDGRVSAVFGTHTHIQTADEKILPQGTAYITDVGMTGPYDSVIGQNKEHIIKRFLTSLPTPFNVAEDDIMLCGILVRIDEKTGKALSIERMQIPFKKEDQNVLAQK